MHKGHRTQIQLLKNAFTCFNAPVHWESSSVIRISSWIQFLRCPFTRALTQRIFERWKLQKRAFIFQKISSYNTWALKWILQYSSGRLLFPEGFIGRFNRVHRKSVTIFLETILIEIYGQEAREEDEEKYLYQEQSNNVGDGFNESWTQRCTLWSFLDDIC